MKHVFLVLFFPVLLGVGCSASEQSEKKMNGEVSLGDLTGPWQLFVDDSLVSEKSHVIRRYHPFQKYVENPVLVGEKAWEGDKVFVYGTVLPSEDKEGYRLWYHAASFDGYRSGYATSLNGLSWDRPNLDLIELGGNRDNNVFFWRSDEDHMPQVIHTPWDPNPDRQYKLINYDYGRTPPDHMTSGFWGAYSPDGIHWTEVENNPVLVDPGDVGNFVWDPHEKRFLGYPKTFAPVRGYRRRAIGFTTTQDFEHWPPAELILVPDEVDDRWVTRDGQHTDLYGLSAFAYESGYIGFLWVFRIEEGRNEGRNHVELVSSRNGVDWIREEGDRPPILPLGSAGSWDEGFITTVNHPVVEGDKIQLYYGGSNDHHTGAGEAGIGLATLRKDGFASLDAGSKLGTVITRALTGTEGPLYVNVDAKGGSLKVEVLDEHDVVISGYSRDDCQAISSDVLDQAVIWRSHRHLPEREGSIKLRFLLTHASLYSFMAGNEVNFASSPVPLEVFFTFEGEQGEKIMDKAVKDGLQAARLYNAVRIEKDPDYPGGGDSALHFLKGEETFNTMEILQTRHLGSQFTLAARVRTIGRGKVRLFSTYRGSGGPVSGELIMDLNPAAGTISLTLNGERVQSSPRFYRDGGYHHFAAIYDHGEVRLYLDGIEKGRDRIRAGTTHLYHDGSTIELRRPMDEVSDVGIHLVSDLRIGEDQAGRFITHDRAVTTGPDNQLVGWVDDVLLAKRVLTVQEISALSHPDTK